MIKLEKRVTYYSKNKYMHDMSLYKKDYTTQAEAVEDFDNMPLYYYINNKYISTCEEITLTYSTGTGVRRLYKKINLDGSTESNQIKEN